jgi:2-polyprenyl-3-methyl-5-hydroxy-6-metoxy-1,4-benzoquinol methylase
MASGSLVPSWWHASLQEVGLKSMEKLLPHDATWEDLLALGRADLERGLRFTQLVPDRNQSVLDIGCGVGRMSQALAEHYGRVVGVDIAPVLLDEARRRNQNPHVSFELIDGPHLQPQSLSQPDVVFSYEVLYLLPPDLLFQYFRDVFALLKPEGVFLFQLNLNPMTWRTHAARGVRRVLHCIGVRKWRGWPTAPDHRRYPYNQNQVSAELSAAEFQVERVAGDSLKQTWFLARKPPGNG